MSNYFYPRNLQAHNAANRGEDVKDYCFHCGNEFMDHTNGICPVAASATTPRRETFAEALSKLEGQTLYELCAQEMSDAGLFMEELFGAAPERALMLPWKRLPSVAQRFWQNLAESYGEALK